MELHQDQGLRSGKEEEMSIGHSVGCDLYADCPMCQTGNLKLLASKTAVCEACGFRYSCCY